jgi:hypothetical protein
MNENLKRLQSRVVSAAEATLAEKNVVSAIDVLMRIGWLTQPRLDEWRQCRLTYLEAGISTNLHKISAAMTMFHRWARGRELTPSETAYVSRTRDRQPLRFSKSGDKAIEHAYRTHWVSRAVSTPKRERLREQQSRAPDLVAICPLHDWTCTKCGGTGDFLLMEKLGPVCRTCAGLDHLVFLAAGDASLSRRARQASGVCAVVVRFSRARKRYERQGILVERAALEAAERTAHRLVDSLNRAD